MASVACIAIGPFGEGYGQKKLWDDGKNHKEIKKIEIHHGDIVGSIRILYDSEWSEVHGNDSNVEMDKTEVTLGSDEFLVSITGTYENFSLARVVHSLTFITNKNKTYGPYGKEKGGAEHFSSESTGCKIIGFFGYTGIVHGDNLDSIGVYVVPLPHDLISIGPFGGKSGGTKFDDGRDYTRIKKIVIRYSDDGLDSIETVYVDKNGKEHWSDVHGTATGGLSPVEVPFTEDEYLAAISGFYHEDAAADRVVIKSLTLQSNKLNFYGPYGNQKESGLKGFESKTSGGKIIGFHGTSGEYINSIGAYFQPLLPIEP